MAITLRLIKGSELTHTELDGNFTDLDSKISVTKNVPTATISAGVLTLDHSVGDFALVTHSENITSVVLSNPPASGTLGSITVFLNQDATGGRTLTGSFLTISGAGVDMGTAAFAKNIINFITMDGGSVYYAMSSGKDFA